ncbi:DUF2652 domain-containing protein [uncultured Kriegella sp.]|uniref:DUF2652 domain-containing protein n=1 Tax=uncultured Kriegella sp. TaxID=1798910 RepID=UPI0030DA041E|tara:strand:+ start:13205 stop:13816 length:612 start_codon:yes stop_codon:yes gene_type:complete
MKAIPTLLCIPDISGFTKFMSDTDFELSSKVIPSLLNKIIYSNEIGLKVSEIEGDAVLFYRTGELPPFEELIAQCKFFYTEFYKQLAVLRNKNGHKRDAAKIPKILGLKIILHYGQEIAVVPVGKRIKLMGEDVIVAHRLLKNDIPFDEYILISESLISMYETSVKKDHFDLNELEKGSIEVEHVGRIDYHYVRLDPLEEGKG